MKQHTRSRIWKMSFFLVILACLATLPQIIEAQPETSISATSYAIVGTGQSKCYNNNSETSCPQSGAAFYGQDAQHDGNQPSYTDNGDGTITDNVTGLMWQQTPNTDGDGDIDAADKLTYTAAGTYCDSLTLASYTDWRLPDIKQLYSLIDFSGIDPSGYEGSDTSSLTPFIDTGYFDFAYGDTSADERIIDAQFASTTLYVATAGTPQQQVFGVNLADGRIKGYGTSSPNGDKTFYVYCVRGDTGYGVNGFSDNGDGTITDNATELMWAQNDNGSGLNWEESLAWVATQNAANYLGYNDWRLPNAKELQSIVDYARSPDTTSSAAIDPLFNVTSITNEAGQTDYPFYWSSTTHVNWTPDHLGAFGVYVAFGRAMGYMNSAWSDVHGAGAQRSDPKSGDPDDWPTGHGPQGDAIRIYNYVRLVRDAGSVEPNVPPTADAGGPYSGAAGDPIPLDGSGSSDTDGTIALYEWDLDDDGQYDDATGVTTDFVAATAGTFTVGLRVTDDDGATDTDTATITVSEIPSGPTYTLAVETEPSNGGTVDLNPPSGVYGYGENAVVELTANPTAGYEFIGWGGDLSGSDNPATLTVTQNMTVTASFSRTVINMPHTVYLPLIVGGAGDASNAADEFNLFAPLRSTNTYLMDNDGHIIHTWTSDYAPGNSVYLLENGNLLRTGNTKSEGFDAGGAGGIVQEIAPDSTVVWEFEYDSDQVRLHHDIEPLPNGNVLMIAWERKTESEAIAAGRNPSLLNDGELWPDHIIEVSPSSGDIVWEWRVWDHLIQDYDPTKENYGVVADHPELIDLNFGTGGPPGAADWNHVNSIDYDESLDQILLSVRSFGEIWVIDHSTTSAEAAGHTGGDRGKGGDLLYRWGNPQAYDAESAADQQLFVQHDAQWIPSGYPGEGNILVFNNGTGRPGGNYSSVDEIVPPVDGSGIYTSYGPTAPIWTYMADNPSDFYAERISGAQRLADGNTLVCDGPNGDFFEVTPEKQIVWMHDYEGQVFRVARYASDDIALDC